MVGIFNLGTGRGCRKYLTAGVMWKVCRMGGADSLGLRHGYRASYLE